MPWLTASAAARPGRARRLDQPAAARRHRLSAGREPRPARAVGSQTAALHGRSAPSARREGPDARPTVVARVRLGRDAGHVAGVAPNSHRRAVRRRYPSWSGTAADHERDPRADRAHGHREPRLEYTRIQGALANL